MLQIQTQLRKFLPPARTDSFDLLTEALPGVRSRCPALPVRGSELKYATRRLMGTLFTCGPQVVLQCRIHSPTTPCQSPTYGVAMCLADHLRRSHPRPKCKRRKHGTTGLPVSRRITLMSSISEQSIFIEVCAP